MNRVGINTVKETQSPRKAHLGDKGSAVETLWPKGWARKGGSTSLARPGGCHTNQHSFSWPGKSDDGRRLW